MRTGKKCTLLVTTILLSLLLTTGTVLAGSEGTSTGTATVISSVPEITSPELWDSGETVNKNNTALTVGTEYHMNFTITDANTLADLDNVTIRIWDSGSAKTENDTDAQVDHYSFTWVESTDVWASTPSGYNITANCQDPGTASSATSYEFTLAFKLSKVAAYATTPDWKISIFVWDDTATPNADSEKTLMFGVAFYSEISITDSTHTWSSLTAGSSTNVTMDSPPLDFTVIANANWDGQAKGSGDLTKGADTIALSNARIYQSNTLTSSASLTTGYVDIGGLTAQSPPTDENSAISSSVYLWLTVPSGTPAGDYVYTLYIQIIQA